MIRERKAAIRIQAWMRRALVRLRWGEVLDKVSERNHWQKKVAKFKSKLQAVRKEREALAESMKSTTYTNTTAREAWEASVLQGTSEEPTPEQSSPLFEEIIKLQAEFRSLQVQTKTVNGIMKPLHKNLASAQETYNGYRTKYLDIQEQIQALEANKKELIRRRGEAEKRTEEYIRESTSLSNPSTMGSGPVDENFHRAFQEIIKILRSRCDDKDLIEDVQEEIDAFSKEDYHYSYSDAPVSYSPQRRRSLGPGLSPRLSSSNPTQGSSGSGGRSRRRTIQGSLAGVGSPSVARSKSPHGRRER